MRSLNISKDQSKRKYFSIELHSREVSMEQKRIKILSPIFLSVIIVILFIATIILSILFGIERSQRKTHENLLVQTNQTDDLCLTPYCIEAGQTDFK